MITELTPEPLGETRLRKSTLHQIREALRDVVNSPRGTGKKSQLEQVDVGGKTGTAQVFRMRGRVKTHTLPRPLRDHAWFVAFAPVDAPEIAIAVLVEHAGQGGGAVAAPLARDLADFYFALTRGRTYELAGAGSDDVKLAQGPPPGAPLPVQMSPEMRARMASFSRG
jgi:penicillin-binding protein 2